MMTRYKLLVVTACSLYLSPAEASQKSPGKKHYTQKICTPHGTYYKTNTILSYLQAQAPITSQDYIAATTCLALAYTKPQPPSGQHMPLIAKGAPTPPLFRDLV